MKALFIGGTGNISTACTLEALNAGWEVFHINRGFSPKFDSRIVTFKGDISNIGNIRKTLAGHRFDVVVNFIAFTAADVERDFEIFRGITHQYIFISSASVYQKPLTHPVITESTPLCNPYWDYSNHKILAEEKLMQLYRQQGFPVTIVRPSHTYQYVIPVAIGSWADFTIIDRMRRGKPVIVHGDGTSLWTLTHSEDFARGFTGLLGHKQAIGHAFHITSDEILTWNQIYDAVAAAAGCEARIVHIASDYICNIADKLSMTWMRGNLLGDKAHSVIFDNSKIKRFVPGFISTVPFSKGIERTIRWFDEDKSRQTIVPENNLLIDRVLQEYGFL